MSLFENSIHIPPHSSSPPLAIFKVSLILAGLPSTVDAASSREIYTMSIVYIAKTTAIDLILLGVLTIISDGNKCTCNWTNGTNYSIDKKEHQCVISLNIRVL